ncbi:hypothetical protein G1L02_06815 [Tenacibaculum finnmarkense]|uniref:thrombospondin type 3 repeat-containing protein n=1 Tax=Tenacibaculum finnmarkense TaxID=2781243 RepID=UPI001EFAB51E|nr:thrombospondin type 3 repeat-containing protein [Tenacibaculum finnmarkense]MCG8882870.1 hypothetical protein [Tenacibaculum finnmarkense]
MGKFLLLLLLLLIGSFNIYSQNIEIVGNSKNSTGIINNLKLKITMPSRLGDDNLYYFVSRYYDKYNSLNYNRITRRYPYFNRDKSKTTFSKIRNRISNPKTIFCIVKISSKNDYDFKESNTYYKIIKSLTYYRNITDFDEDGVLNSTDNCPNKYNPNQNDKDNDGKGDVCDTQDNRDSDGDGIQNWKDDCPNKKGPSSNNGCPLPTGKPDFTVYGISINEKEGNNRKLIGNDYNNVCVTIKNIGNAPGKAVDITLLLSTKYKYMTDSNNSNIIPQLNTESIIEPGETLDVCINSYIYINNLTVPLFNYKYIVANIDWKGRSKDSNHYNNIRIMSLNQSSRPSKPSLIILKNSLGLEVKKQYVKTKKEEQNLIKSLPQGLYYINKDGKKSQIYKR